jgi:hypothetical protein
MAIKQPITIDEAREKVGGIDYTKSFLFDYSDRGVNIEYDGEQWSFHRNGKEKQVSPIAIRSLVKAVNLPLAFSRFAESDPKLLAMNVNYLMGKQAGGARALQVKNRIMAFAPPDASIIKNQEVLNAIEKRFGKEAKIDKCDIGVDGLTNINVVSEENELKIEKGDLFNSGVHIQNHPFGVVRPEIDGYLLRLVCLNGAIGTDEVFRAPMTMGEDPKQWLHSSIKKARYTTSKLFSHIKELKGKAITGNTQDLLDGLYIELDIPNRVQDLINSRVHKHGADSMYDIFNHLTYVASNIGAVRREPILRNRLMRASSHFASHIGEVCQNCQRPQISFN